MRYLIDAIIRHGPVVKEFRLAAEGGAPLPSWQPGAHVELEFTSRAGASQGRAYSRRFIRVRFWARPKSTSRPLPLRSSLR